MCLVRMRGLDTTDLSLDLIRLDRIVNLSVHVGMYCQAKWKFRVRKSEAYLKVHDKMPQEAKSLLAM